MLSTLSRRAASRTSQGLAELAHDNKKVDSQSTFRQLVHLLVLFSASSPNFGQTLSLSSRRKRRGKKRMAEEEWNPYNKHSVLLLNSVLLLRANKNP